MRVSVPVVAICLAVIGISAAQESAAAIRKSTNIPAQGLGPALQALAKDFDVQTVFVTEDVKDRRTQGAAGELTIEEALTKVLAGTGLSYRYLDDRTITIVPESLNSDASGAVNIPGGGSSEGGTVQPGVLMVARAQGDDGQSSSVPALTEESDELAEVVVTGTHIRGTAPAGANLLTITRDDIELSGHSRIEDVLAALPENFRGVSEQESQIGTSNVNEGAEIQLRGLGFGTTLVLVNGQRQAAGGMRGAFTDVSSIPLAAIERIEVLKDGASAIYGSDAIGGVVNIVLRKTYSGTETRAIVGAADGGVAEELQLSQTLGASWERGGGMFGYQYQRRNSLPAADREYSRANGDMTPFGGTDLRDPLSQFSGNPGTILTFDEGTPAFAIPTGQDGTSLTTDDLLAGEVNYTDNVSFNDLLSDQELHSAFFNLSQQFGELWELGLDGRIARRNADSLGGTSQQTVVLVPTTNPFYLDPFETGDPLLVAYDFTHDVGPERSSSRTDSVNGSVELTRRFASNWQIRSLASYSEEDVRSRRINQLDADAVDTALADEDPATALNVFGDGSNTNPATLAGLTVDESRRSDYRLWSAGLVADGKLFGMRGGAARLAIGTDYRDEHIDTEDGSLDAADGRSLIAAFAEVALPFFGPGNRRAGVEKLDLSLAARYEEYSDFGSTLDPKVSLSYKPVPALTLRGSWGTSFRAPPLFQSAQDFGTRIAIGIPVPDPTSPTGGANALLVLGNNPDLQEETADVWTAGLDFEPPSIAGLEISLTYFDYRYDGRIDAPESQSSILGNEHLWGPTVVNRDPTQEEIDAICNGPGFLFGNCTDVDVIIDRRWLNLAVLNVNGVDAAINHSLVFSFGTFHYGVAGTYTIKHERGVTAQAPVVDVVDTLGNPLKLRWRANLSWNRGGWTAGAFVNHTGQYRTSTVAPATPVDSWTTVDLNFGYRFPESAGWLSGTRVALNAINALDKIAPFVDEFDGYDGSNANVLGRQLSLHLVKEW